MFGKFLWLVVGLVWVGAGCASASAIAADAGESKPVAVVSISSLDAAFTDITEAMKLFGESEIVKSAKLMKNVFTRGISNKKPIGIFVVPNATQDKLCIIASIPIDDLKAVIETYKPQDEGSTDAGDGVLRLSISGFDVFAKEQGEDLLVAQHKEDLAVAPKEPVKLLGDLPQKADIVVRFDAENLPEAMKDMTLNDLMFDLAEKSKEDYKDAPAFNDGNAELFGNVIGLESQLARNTKTQVLSTATSIRFAPDSPLHKYYLARREIRSDASNFVQPDAVASFALVSRLTDETEQTLQLATSATIRWLTADSHEVDAEPEVVRKRFQTLAGISNLAASCFENNTSDFGASLNYEPQKLSFVLSTQISDSDALRESLQELAAIPYEHEEAAKIEIDVEKHGEIALHRITKAIPKQLKGLAKMMGEEFSIIIGTGNGRVYVASGRDSLATMKKYLDKPFPAQNEMETVVTASPFKLANLLKEAQFSQTFNKWLEEKVAKESKDDATFLYKSELRKDAHVSQISVPMREAPILMKSGELMWTILRFGFDPADNLRKFRNEDESENE